MSAQYDTAEWAAETTLGRRVFNANFRMTGNELPGWQLVKYRSAGIIQYEAYFAARIKALEAEIGALEER